MWFDSSLRSGGSGLALVRAPAPAPGERASGAPPGLCAHCGSPTVGAAAYCCEGCRAVHASLIGQGLGRWYDLRGGAVAPAAGDVAARVDGTWLELTAAELAASAPGLRLVPLGVQGVSCAACVWLLDELFRRTGQAGRAEVNPARGTLDLWVDRDFPLADYVRDAGRFGYALGPRSATAAPGDDLLVRLGVCAALAMNVMIFAIARYAGLEDPPTLRLFHLLELGLSLAAFVVGGSVFVRGAIRSLARGILHLDLPIALGLVLGYAGSVASLLLTGGADSYFDTLVVFTTLMLAGRYLRERVVSTNRARLLDDQGAEGLLVRRVDREEDGRERVAIVPAPTLRAGDVVLVAPGDVLPVRAELLDASATVSLEWITGEADPSPLSRGASAPAGASVVGPRAARFRVVEDLSASALLDLLRAPLAGRDEPGRFERRVATVWVPFVLLASSAAFGGWLLSTGDPARALAVTVGLLVVTCPCAFGIATPLGQEVVLAELRRRGLLVRNAGFLERAADVRRVVFDKTGTLTTGTLRLRDASLVSALPLETQRILHDLAVRSSHPKSAAIVAALPAEARTFDASRVVREVAGAGVEVCVDGSIHRLGSGAFAADGHAANDAAGADVFFSRDGAILAQCATEEVLRPDAAAEVLALGALGHEVWMLTGDARGRALTVAADVGIPEARVVSGCSPADKAAWLAEHDRGDVLFLGDGINDALAAGMATTSGTPAAGRTFLAARTDFYLLGDGLRGVRLALSGARALRRRTGANLHLAAAYNVGALALCLGGWMSPLLAAVLMPASSLLAIGWTLRDLARRGASWTS